MSAGHSAHRDDVPDIDDAFYLRVKDMVDACKRDRDHTIPWLANRSVDGKVVYIDSSVPNILPKCQINTGETLPYHELGEWLGMNEGMDYDEAHKSRGNPCEKRRVEELGGDWQAYQEEFAPLIREVGDEALTNIPADIDKRVFVDDDDKAALEAIIADNKGAAVPTQLKYAAGSVVATGGTLGERQIRVIASDSSVDRVKDIMVPEGCVLDSYKANPIFLFNHDPAVPVGNAAPVVGNGRVEALVEFAPKGVSAKADEVCGLYKSGVLRAVSVGFQPIEWEPIKDGGVRYTKWALMEISGVSVPANPNAVTIERSMPASTTKAASWKVGASRNLPIDEDSTWDGAAAEKSIFDHCGFDGDSPNTSLARKGFLLYDASKPKLKGSYKEPFAKMSGGRMVAVAAGIRNAASRLPQVEGVPDDVKKSASAVIAHYEKKMKDKDGKGAPAPRTKQIEYGKAGKIKIKGLYDCAALARVLLDLGFIHDGATWEASIEQDGSKLPAMLAGVLRDCAEALIAMTQEEVNELLDGHGVEVLPIDENYVALGATPRAKSVRAAFAKAGRVLSQDNLAHLKEIGKCLKDMADCHEKAAQLHDDLHDNLVDMMDHGTSAGEHMKALFKSAKKKPADGDDAADDNDTEDDDDDADAGGDQELAGEAAVRKRELDLLERSVPLI